MKSVMVSNALESTDGSVTNFMGTNSALGSVDDFRRVINKLKDAGKQNTASLESFMG